MRFYPCPPAASARLRAVLRGSLPCDVNGPFSLGVVGLSGEGLSRRRAFEANETTRGGMGSGCGRPRQTKSRLPLRRLRLPSLRPPLVVLAALRIRPLEWYR